MRVFFFFLLANTALAAKPLSWEKTFGGSKKDALHSVLERPDGTFVGVGKTFSEDGDLKGQSNRGRQDAWLVHLSKEGKLLQSQTYGGSGMDVFTAAANTSDGGFVVLGSTHSTDGKAEERKSDDADVWLIKFSAENKWEWQKFLGGENDDLGMALFPLPDGKILVGADSLSSGNGHHGCAGGHRDFLLLKLDEAGEVEWQRSYGGSNHDYLSQIIATSDGNFALGGRTESSDGDVTGFMGEYDGWVVKIDPAGKILWEKTLGGEMWDWGSNIAPGNDGGIVFSGYAFSWDGDGAGNHGDYDYFLVSLDKDGKRLWHKTYGGAVDDFAQGLVRLKDGTYLVTGGSVSKDGDVPENRGNFDLWAIRVSEKGELLWSRTFGGSAYDISTTGGSDYYEAAPGGSLMNTRDGGVVVAGASKSSDGDVSPGHGGFDSWVVKWSPEIWAGKKLAKRGQARKLSAKKPPEEKAPQKAPAIQWAKSFGGKKNDLPLDSPQALINNGSGGFLFVASTESNGFDAMVTNVSAEGKLLWQKTFGGSKRETAAAIALAPEGGSVFVATTESKDGDVGENKGGSDIWVVRLDTEGKMLWKKTLGGSLEDQATSVIVGKDGSITLGGTTYSSDGDVKDHLCGHDFWIVKLDKDGNTLWSRSAGGLSNDYLIQLVETQSGGIAAIGRTESETLDAKGNFGMYDYLLVQLDKNGEKIFARTYGNVDWEWGNSVVALKDGGFALSGYTYTFDDFELGQVKCNHGEMDYWVIRLDEKGEPLWQNCFGGSNYELGYGMIETKDGGLALVGGSRSEDGQVAGKRKNAGWDGWVVKMNSSGKLVWQKPLGGTGYDVAYALVEAQDGGLAVLLESFSKDGDVTDHLGQDDAWLVKLAP